MAAEGKGNRSFAALLDELLQDEAGRMPIGNPPSIDYLAVAEELHSGRIHFTGRHARDEYAEAGSPLADTVAEPVAEEAPPLSVEPDDIARELGLRGRLKARDLDRLRRDFAARNHPDRVPPHLRDNAMTRMQVANRLIDEAKAAAPKGFRLRRRRSRA